MAHSHIDEVRLVSHSNVVYWWPAWALGYLLVIVSYLEGDTIRLENGVTQYIHPSNNPGLLFIATLVFVLLSEDWRSPFYLLWLASLALPATHLAMRQALWLAFALRFRAPDRTLKEGEASAARDAAVAVAAERTGAVQRV